MTNAYATFEVTATVDGDRMETVTWTIGRRSGGEGRLLLGGRRGDRNRRRRAPHLHAGVPRRLSSTRNNRITESYELL
ncbi:hypothetical protein D8S78_05275 [Natrialba swarupiae]|nr:hypothetical protein [Natrialba swarupiae]